MKSKWSKVIKSENDTLVVETFEMTELIPFGFLEDSQKQIAHKEEEEKEEVTEPPHDCSHLQEQAFQAGRDAGIQEGKAQCHLEIEHQQQRALRLVGQVEEARLKMLQNHEQDLVALSLAIAKKVIHAEVSWNKEILVNQVQQMMKTLSSNNGVHLKVHPDEVAILQAQQENFLSREGEPLSILIEGDASMAVGGCMIETDSHYLDASLERQLEIIGNTLQEMRVNPKQNSDTSE